MPSTFNKKCSSASVGLGLAVQLGLAELALAGLLHQPAEHAAEHLADDRDERQEVLFALTLGLAVFGLPVLAGVFAVLALAVLAVLALTRRVLAVLRLAVLGLAVFAVFALTGRVLAVLGLTVLRLAVLRLAELSGAVLAELLA